MPVAGAGAGLNVTDNVHEPAAGIIAVQSFVTAKSAESATLAPVILSTAGLAPVFFTVSTVGADVVPASWAPKVIGPGGASGGGDGYGRAAERNRLRTFHGVVGQQDCRRPTSGLLRVERGVDQAAGLGAESGGAIIGLGELHGAGGRDGNTFLLMVITALPVFVKVIPTGALVSPTVCVPKATLSGVTETSVEAMPVPESATVCGLPLALSVKLKVAVTGRALAE